MLNPTYPSVSLIISLILRAKLYTIWQSPDRALWWSTKDGIDRYNGAYIKHYQMGDPKHFSNSAGLIIKLAADNDSTLIAFDNKGGIFDYNEQQDRFMLRTDLTAIFGHDIILNDVLPTENGLWIAMREGAFLLQPKKPLTAILKDVYANTFVAVHDKVLLCTRNGVYSCSNTPQKIVQSTHL